MEDEREELTQEEQYRQNKGKLFGAFLWAALFFAVTGAAAFFFYQIVYRVEPAFSTATYELGEEVSREPGDYLLGTEWSVERAQLDLSQVDGTRAGTYQAAVSHGREEYVFEIVIRDTVAPEIELREGPIYLAAGRDYSPENLIAGVTDQDPQVSVGFLKADTLVDTVSFEETGSFVCAVAAEDSSGNREVVNVPVTVDTAPEITGVQDIYMVLGSQVDYLEQVRAADERDGDLTGRLIVEDSAVVLTQEGTYHLTYRVEDDLGIDTEVSAQVTVCTAETLQEMIGNRLVDRRQDRIIGAINLYDSGVSDQDSIEEALEYARPSMVQLYYSMGSGYSAGSGYIMEITEDTIYICSNRHVVETHDRWEVYFFDGTRVRGTPLGVSDQFDVGVVTVAVEEVPGELLDQLMTVHVDREYWSRLNDQRIDVGLERVDREGGVLHVSTGTLVKVKQHFVWFDQRDHTEVTLKLEHGDSGSAVLDGYGNLIGMAYAYSSSPRRYWCVPLDGVLECYEEITGRSVYVY